MLSKIIKEKIETEFGQSVKYPRDCDALSADISTKTNQRISGSTIRRLFGFISGTVEPRSYTLDVIAEYVGYPSFEALIEGFKETPSESERIIELIDAKDLKAGEKIRLSFDINNHFCAEYIGESKFKVDDSSCDAIQLNDIVSVAKIRLHQPLFVENLLRDNVTLGPNVLAKVSGVKSIELLP
jgi:hypothetical protein